MPPVARVQDMGEITNQSLREIGRGAASFVPELGKVAKVEVADTLDSSNESTYLFSFLLDRAGGEDSASVGRAYIRLVQALRDGLMDHGDNHYPLIRLFTKEDWGRRRGA